MAEAEVRLEEEKARIAENKERERQREDRRKEREAKKLEAERSAAAALALLKLAEFNDNPVSPTTSTTTTSHPLIPKTSTSSMMRVATPRVSTVEAAVAAGAMPPTGGKLLSGSDPEKPHVKLSLPVHSVDLSQVPPPAKLSSRKALKKTKSGLPAKTVRVRKTTPHDFDNTINNNNLTNTHTSSNHSNHHNSSKRIHHKEKNSERSSDRSVDSRGIGGEESSHEKDIFGTSTSPSSPRAWLNSDERGPTKAKSVPANNGPIRVNTVDGSHSPTGADHKSKRFYTSRERNTETGSSKKKITSSPTLNIDRHLTSSSVPADSILRTAQERDFGSRGGRGAGSDKGEKKAGDGEKEGEGVLSTSNSKKKHRVTGGHSKTKSQRKSLTNVRSKTVNEDMSFTPRPLIVDVCPPTPPTKLKDSMAETNPNKTQRSSSGGTQYNPRRSASSGNILFSSIKSWIDGANDANDPPPDIPVVDLLSMTEASEDEHHEKFNTSTNHGHSKKPISSHSDPPRKTSLSGSSSSAPSNNTTTNNTNNSSFKKSSSGHVIIPALTNTTNATNATNTTNTTVTIVEAATTSTTPRTPLVGLRSAEVETNPLVLQMRNRNLDRTKSFFKYIFSIRLTKAEDLCIPQGDLNTYLKLSVKTPRGTKIQRTYPVKSTSCPTWDNQTFVFENPKEIKCYVMSKQSAGSDITIGHFSINCDFSQYTEGLVVPKKYKFKIKHDPTLRGKVQAEIVVYQEEK